MELPHVSVIVPVRNEGATIDSCLRAILAQDYPRELMEIIVVDGMSVDHTYAIVEELSWADNRIRLFSNPRRRTPYSMNVGLACASGSVLVRIDGHSLVEPDHVRRCVQFLLESGADHVGGVVRAVGRTYVARTIALATSSPLGVGSARFRYTEREQVVDTVPFGAFHRETILRLGGFDEHFLIGQDSELDHRINLSGGTVRVTPTIATRYFCRDSLRRLAIQYFRYGRARAHMLHKHGSLPSLRTIPPALLVLLIGLATLGTLVGAVHALVLAALLGSYATGCIAAAISIAAGRGLRYVVLLPVVLATLHVSHGCGFWSAMPTFLRPWPGDRRHGSLTMPPEYA